MLAWASEQGVVRPGGTFSNQVRKIPGTRCLGMSYYINVLGGPITVAVWTPKKFFPLLTRPQGSQGCQKIRFFSTNKTVEYLR